MKVRTVRVSFSRKVHPRAYNPVETIMEEVIDLDPEDNPREVRIKAYRRLKKDVDRLSEQLLEDEKE